MKNKKISVNKISAGLMIGVILVMAIRIAYVNITYPSTDIKIIKNSDTLYKKDYSVKVLSATDYTRDEWGDRIGQLGILHEEDVYNILKRKRLLIHNIRCYIIPGIIIVS